MSADATREFVKSLGYESVDAFCADIGLPAHIAERWGRFGVSGEMKQVFTLLAAQRKTMAEAIAESGRALGVPSVLKGSSTRIGASMIERMSLHRPFLRLLLGRRLPVVAGTLRRQPHRDDFRVRCRFRMG